VNASVEFDIKTLQPTYFLTIGLPGRSNALAIAQRLGLNKAIIENARQELDPDEIRAEDLLNEIHHQRDMARKARSDADRMRSQAENMRNQLNNRLEEIEDERRKLLESARLQSESDLHALQQEMNEVRKALARARQPLDALQPIEDEIEDIAEVVEQPVERVMPDLIMPESRALRLGDKVHVRTLGTQGIVTALGTEEVEVSVGNLRLRTRLVDLELASKSSATAEKEKVGKTTKSSTAESSSQESSRRFGSSLPASPGMELDLRGQRADEAEDALDRYLDTAFLAGLPFVRIIHGKGTGRLREVVRQALTQNANVKSFELGGEKEGGEGVTVVKF
jgi:DNA mismatch repair protein MutS2